jgi:hypothetical protein
MVMNQTYNHRAAQLDLFFKRSSQSQPQKKNTAFDPEKVNLKNFIKSIIKQRQLLLEEGNRKDAVQVELDIAFISRHLEFNNYSKNQLAGFFLRHYARIFYLAVPNRQPQVKELKSFYQSKN